MDQVVDCSFFFICPLVGIMAEVAADGTRWGSSWFGVAEEFSNCGDGRRALNSTGDDGVVHVVQQVLIEILVLMFLVVVGKQLLIGVDGGQLADGEVGGFDPADDGADEAAVDGVGFEQDERLLCGHTQPSLWDVSKVTPNVARMET